MKNNIQSFIIAAIIWFILYACGVGISAMFKLDTFFVLVCILGSILFSIIYEKIRKI